MAIASVTRNGVTLTCRATGAGAGGGGLLLIHGLNANMAFWHPLLVRSFSANRRLLMYDQRGHGNSDTPANGYTLTELAADALAILDAHDMPAADVVAHSFGTGVALQLARLWPDRVRSIAVLDGRIRSVQGEVRLRDWSHFARWVEPLNAAGMTVDPDWEIDCRLPLRMEKIDFSRVAAGLEAGGFFVPRINKRSFEKYRRLLSETSALEEYDQPDGLTPDALKQIQQQVLLVYGAASPFLPTCDILAGALPNAQAEILDGAGHNFPLARPEPTLAAIARWGVLELAAAQPCNLTH